MPKRRYPKSDNVEIKEREIEKFANEADRVACFSDRYAPHKYKSIRVPMNKYLYDILDSAAKRARRSKLDFIRLAIEKVSEENSLT